MGRELRALRRKVLSREVGAARKEWGGRTRVVLVYPNRYATGMSNLGFLTVHARINARRDALCERAFLPGPAEWRLLRDGGLPLAALESGRPLSDFDVVAFSLSYENDLLNVPPILAGGGVGPFRELRGGARPRPLVLAGGFAASLNPEPSGTIADAVVVGDGERAVESILSLGNPRPGDPGYLADLASVPGVYVPGGYEPGYAGPGPEGGLLALSPRPGFPARVVREAVPLADFPPVLPVLSEDAEFGRMALVETSRGCPRMCGFCAAAHACPRYREVPLAHARAAVDAAWPHRKRIGLIGAAVLDWSPFKELSREILARGGAVSPASVRADLVDDETARILGRSGHRTVALAPECGDEHLRARIGKRMPDEVFLAAAGVLVRAGIVSFKLYFLVGLPGTSRDEEVDGTVRFLEKFRNFVLGEGRAAGRLGTVTATLSPFVPKPFTPMQWAPMAPEAELEGRQERIARAVRRLPNIRVAPDAPRQAVVQAYLGLSDRRAEAALARARNGRMKTSGPDAAPGIGRVVFREKEAEERFPWDVIEGGMPRRTLRARYEAMRRGGGRPPADR
ncbi:MAG: B12-binding domain-containing radical SAM protein [Gemmatimonadota bacterium]